MKYILLFYLTFFALYINAEEKFTLSGTVSDASTGEVLPAAAVSFTGNVNSGVSTSQYGFYSITLPKGNYVFRVSYLGYNSAELQINLNKNIFQNFKLEPFSKELTEITISAQKKNDNIISEKIGVERLQIKEISKIPVFFGEQDILKTLTLTPGVKTVGEGNGGIYVRGGSNAQNLILLDEATVYNANHLLGFFSTFNSDAIREVQLFKGTAPAEYGGRLSSVIDVRMNEGNNRKYGVNGGVGLISSRLTVEGPIVKDKSSFLISGRRTYADLFLKLSDNEQINSNQLFFYDFNAKLNYRLGEKDRLYLSGYLGRDIFSMAERFSIDWGNKTFTGRWNRIWAPKLFSNTTFIFSDFDYGVGINFDETSFKILSRISNLNLKSDFQYFFSEKDHMLFGFDIIRHEIIPGQVEADSSAVINPVKIESRFGYESALYVSNVYKPSQQWNINTGVRLSMFNLIGPGSFPIFTNGEISDSLVLAGNGIVKNYFNIEPRVVVSHIIDSASSVKFSYTRNTQNLHVVSNSTGSLPSDIWLMSGLNVKPEIADQVSLGFFKNFSKDLYQLSAETYYKKMYNQPDLKNGADIRANDKIEGELLFGTGRAYGLELMLKKTSGKFNGWISYTLSRSELKIPGINQGNWYPARQDNTHDFSIVGIYDLMKNLSLSGTWVYQTGNAITFPSGKYVINGEVRNYYTERNGYRMPPYHRLDLGATWYFKKRKNFDSNLNVSVYNAYARKNAFSIDFEQNPDKPEETQAVMTYLYTIIPSITYNFRF